MACLLNACAHLPPPIDPAAAPDPEIIPIAASFERTVTRLLGDDDTDWRSGWTGNIFVNMSDGDDRGLCHHWRDAVYQGVLFDVRAQGWTTRGIVVNKACQGEHHAVLVYRPGLAPHDLLPDPPESGVYVLDAWRRGRPDIYTLDDWIKTIGTILAPPALTDVGAEIRQRRRRPPTTPAGV